MASFLLSIALYLYTASAEIIDTTISYQYQNQHINCSNNENCTILCDESYACQGSTIFCPTNAECHISCTQQYSCRDITIRWPPNSAYSLSCNDGVFNSGMGACQSIIYKPYDDYKEFLLNCTGDSVCRDSHIICPQNAECNILCDGRFACYNAIFLCPNSNEHQCNITCKGDYSCYFTRFEGNGIVSSCDGEGACLWMIFPYPLPNTAFSLQCNDKFSCSWANIHCPRTQECHIQCNGENSCSDTFIEWPISTSINASLSCSKLVQACSTGLGIVIGPPQTDIYYNNSNDDLIVNCGTEVNCIGNIIHCPLNGSCTVNCIGDNACAGTIFNWIEHQPHSVVCKSGEYVCYGIELHASDPNSDFYFDCTDVPHFGVCESSTIICPINASCTVECGSTRSCARATIYGPENHKLTIICAGEMYGCDDATVYARNVSELFIECSQFDACTNMILWIPINDNHDTPATIINKASKDGIRNTIIYAVNGWGDVKFTNFQSDQLGEIEHKGKIICTSNYISWCNWDLYQWKCASSGDTTCGTEEIVWPTTANPTHPSSKPTQYPSSDPTLEPTIDPTSDTTIDPTIDPTTNPTVKQSSHPTTNLSTELPTNPTVNPSSIPTSNATAYLTSNPTARSSINPSIYATINPSTAPHVTTSIKPTIHQVNTSENVEQIAVVSQSTPITEIVVVMIVVIIVFIAMAAIIIYIACQCKGYSKIDTNDCQEIEMQKKHGKTDIITADIDDEVLERMEDILDEEFNKTEHHATNTEHDEQVTTMKTLLYDEEEEEEESEQILCEGMDECTQIANILKECAGARCEKYLENFRNNVITDTNIKFIDVNDKEEWKQLIPETGIRCHFLALLKDKQNK